MRPEAPDGSIFSPESADASSFLIVRSADLMGRTCAAFPFLPWDLIGESPLAYVPLFPKIKVNPDWGGAIVTSPRALEALGPDVLAFLAAMPVYVVGPGTAEAVGRIGFSHVVCSPSGMAAGLLDPIRTAFSSSGKSLVYLRGAEVRADFSALLAPYEIPVDSVVVYRSVPAPALHERTLAALSSGRVRGAAFFSPASAAQFCTLARTAGLPSSCFSEMDAFCFSPAVLRSLQDFSWGRTFVAASPDLPALAACCRSVYGF